MPLTEFQRRLLALLAARRSSEGYLAGGAALHFSPNSARYSHDLDFFHDSAKRVAEAFASDRGVLDGAGYSLELVFSQPGFIRAVVSRDGTATRVDWAHDSSWRFMPLVQDDLGGFLLHPVDLAVNKALALAGRDEPRDLVDILFVHETILDLGPLVWAAVGKDPGFSPQSLLEQLRRSGRFQSEDLARLDLAQPFDLEEGKHRWLKALSDAEYDAYLRRRWMLILAKWAIAEAIDLGAEFDDFLADQVAAPEAGRPAQVSSAPETPPGG